MYMGPEKITSIQDIFHTAKKGVEGKHGDYILMVSLQDLGDGKKSVFIDITDDNFEVFNAISIELLLKGQNSFDKSEKIYFHVNSIQETVDEQELVEGFFDANDLELVQFLKTIVQLLTSLEYEEKDGDYRFSILSEIILKNIHHDRWNVDCKKSVGVADLVVKEALNSLTHEGFHIVEKELRGKEECEIKAFYGPGYSNYTSVYSFLEKGDDGQADVVTIREEEPGRVVVKTRGVEYEIGSSRVCDIYQAVNSLATESLDELLSRGILVDLSLADASLKNKKGEFLPSWAQFDYEWKDLTAETLIDMPKLLKVLQNKRNYASRTNDIDFTVVRNENDADDHNRSSDKYVIKVKSHKAVDGVNPLMVLSVKSENDSSRRGKVLIEAVVYYENAKGFPNKWNVISVLSPSNVLNVYRVIHQLILVLNATTKFHENSYDVSIKSMNGRMAYDAHCIMSHASPDSIQRITNINYLCSEVKSSLYQPLEDNIDVRNVCKYDKPPRGVAIVDLSAKNLDGELVISDIKSPKITSTVMGVPLTVKETPTREEVRGMASELVEYLANPLPKK